MSKNIVVIGGGHGQSLICKAIKNIDGVNISAIVTVADDGGSTGRLRRYFHIPAVGDIRNVLVSLAENETIMSELMNFRFEDPEGTQNDIHGHSLGNLILAALTRQTGSFLEAIQQASDFLNVKGKIIPASTQLITLYAHKNDGTVVQGEANIPDPANKIDYVFYDGHVEADPDAVESIVQADLILYGIGSVYTSIIPNIIIPDIQKALAESKAKKVYVCNAMTQPGETDNFTMEEHVCALRKHGAIVDAVIVADDEIPKALKARYEAGGSTPVTVSETEHDYDVYFRSLLNFGTDFIRHDVGKIRETVRMLLDGIK